MKFEITILGCGSATPTLARNPTSQVVNIMDRYMLIDCAEGTQIQLRKYKVAFQKIDHIFISHLHGDHYLGLVGLISSFHLFGRNKTLHIYGPTDLERIIFDQLKVSSTFLGYPIEFHPLVNDCSELIFEDNIVEVFTIPLKHRIYCNGFLFKEKKKERRLSKALIAKYKIPVEMMTRLKKGEDWGSLKNEELTLSPHKERSYAFCSDTCFTETIVPIIKGVNLLYHESTFLNDMKDRAKSTFHSTAKQAAKIALLAGVDSLLLGHYSARYKSTNEFEVEAKQIYSFVQAVKDGDVIQIPL
ncbi:MAG: ribonuclease Z [Flavobacteriales bacterium]|nr:ribonuclease Z [Flavobacteriales bacterium]